MIDLLQELKKFKPIEIEHGEDAPETDKAAEDAILYYNKAIGQIESALEDMAKANLKKAVSLRPDFSHAICLLAAVMLARGDRLGVVRLQSSVEDPETKRVVSPYIEYLFGEYDRVEYTKEKKEKPMPSLGPATDSGTSAVYINIEGKKSPKPFSDSPVPTERTVRQPVSGVDFTNPPFEMDNDDDEYDVRQEQTSREDFYDRKNDFSYSDQQSRGSRQRSRYSENYYEYPSKQPEERVDYFAGRSAGKPVERADDKPAEKEIDVPEKKTYNRESINSSADKLSALRREKSGTSDWKNPYSAQEKEEKVSVQKKTSSNGGHKYSKEEIRRNRIIVLGVLAFIIAFIVMIIIMCDQAAQIRKLKKSADAGNKYSLTEISPNS